MNKLLYVFCFFSLFYGNLVDQDEPAFKRGIFSAREISLPLRTLYPKEFDSTQKYPLVLFLHGAGERGIDNEKQLVHGSKLFLESRSSYPALVVFPQCPPDDYWANVKRFRNENGQRQFDFKTGGDPTKPMSGLLSLIDSLVVLPFVDANKVYVVGLSMGGMGTFEIVSRRSNVFAAAIPICGGDHPKSIQNYRSNVPMWIFHGQDDSVVLPEYSEKMYSALKEARFSVKYTSYPNTNHNSWDPAFSEEELLPWLFSQAKE